MPKLTKELTKLHASSLQFFLIYSIKTGINAEDNAPKINRLNIKSGILKAAK